MGVSSLVVTRLRLRRRAATAWRRADRALCFTDLDRRRSEGMQALHCLGCVSKACSLAIYLLGLCLGDNAFLCTATPTLGTSLAGCWQ